MSYASIHKKSPQLRYRHFAKLSPTEKITIYTAAALSFAIILGISMGLA